MRDITIVTNILWGIVAGLFFAKGFAIAVLKKYRLANWPYRTPISQRKAWWIGVIQLLLGPVLLWWSLAREPMLILIAAFLMLAMSFLLPWHIDIREGYRKQERNHDLLGK